MTGSSEDVRLKDVPVLTKPVSLKELGHSISHFLAAASGPQASAG
jgi:hypothetical protein